MSENKCCPNLIILGCADSKDHKHLVCEIGMTIIANDTVKNFCVSDFEKCVQFDKTLRELEDIDD